MMSETAAPREYGAAHTQTERRQRQRQRQRQSAASSGTRDKSCGDMLSV
jgi:hypothetical protein